MLRFTGRSELNPEQLKALDVLLDEIVAVVAPEHDGDVTDLRTDLAYLLFEEAVRGPINPAELKEVVIQRSLGGDARKRRTGQSEAGSPK